MPQLLVRVPSFGSPLSRSRLLAVEASTLHDLRDILRDKEGLYFDELRFVNNNKGTFSFSFCLSLSPICLTFV
jgi:hypothetical protein